MAHTDICPCLHGNYVCLLWCRECFPDAAKASEDDIRAEFHRMAAAPAVDSDLWCDHREYVFPTGLRHPDWHGFDPCPGPHRTLYIGPEVES